MRFASKYFPINEAQKEWGLYATCVGHGKSEPHAEFPSHAHPDEYFFSWESGRILREWQIILIESGGGVVEFRKRRHIVRPGSLIALPPGCWHRYRPNPATGWTTFWIGFGGDLAQRLCSVADLARDGVVRDMSSRTRFHRLFADTVSDMLENGSMNVYTTAARIPMLVASLAEESQAKDGRANGADAIHRAQLHIMEHCTEVVDFAALAESLDLPYRTFRYMFRKECGMPPLQYQLGLRLARAKALLKSSDMPIARIAEVLGFNSTWYFSHFFTKSTGVGPREYRTH